MQKQKVLRSRKLLIALISSMLFCTESSKIAFNKAIAHEWQEVHIFCRPAKDYAGCIKYHQSRSADSSKPARAQSMQRYRGGIYLRRRSGDIIEFHHDSVVRKVNGKSSRYVAWNYLIYYFAPPNDLTPLVTIPAPESKSGQMVYMYGPVLWRVEADCLDHTANWIGDNKPWLNLKKSRTESALEALQIMNLHC